MRDRSKLPKDLVVRRMLRPPRRGFRSRRRRVFLEIAQPPSGPDARMPARFLLHGPVTLVLSYTYVFDLYWPR
jgi:hypothetical protein